VIELLLFLPIVPISFSKLKFTVKKLYHPIQEHFPNYFLCSFIHIKLHTPVGVTLYSLFDVILISFT